MEYVTRFSWPKEYFRVDYLEKQNEGDSFHHQASAWGAIFDMRQCLPTNLTALNHIMFTGLTDESKNRKVIIIKKFKSRRL